MKVKTNVNDAERCYPGCEQVLSDSYSTTLYPINTVVTWQVQ